MHRRPSPLRAAARHPAWAAALAALASGCAHTGAASDRAATAGAASSSASPGAAAAGESSAEDDTAALYCGESDVHLASRVARQLPAASGSMSSPQAMCDEAARRRSLAVDAPGSAAASADRAVDHACRVRRCVARRLDHARTARDVIDANCQGDKLTQLDAVLRIAVETRTQLDDAEARGDAAERDHQIARLRALAQRATELGREANQCIGGGLARVGPRPPAG